MCLGIIQVNLTMRSAFVIFVLMTTPYVDIHTHRPTDHAVGISTAGVHPWRVLEEHAGSLLPLFPKVQAIGEIGLDHAVDIDPKRQLDVFREQLHIACELGKPVVLHCVRAFEEIMKELAACEPRAVIFHGFIGSVEQAQRALSKGYYLSFGERTFASPKTVEALRATPPSRLFFETDDSTTPIEEIYARAAAVLGADVEELKRATCENYERIFSKI